MNRSTIRIALVAIAAVFGAKWLVNKVPALAPLRGVIG